MFTFPKSISDPSAAPVAGFVAGKTAVPAAGTRTDASDGFARMLKDASKGAAESAGATGASGASGSGAAGTATSAAPAIIMATTVFFISVSPCCI